MVPPMAKLKVPNDDPCRCQFRRMMWGLTAGVLSLIGVSSIRHEWASEHLYLTLAIGGVGCIITTGSAFGIAFYYQCLMSHKR
jgi:acyl CoA:acetate/3-ketoacid CoA transferase